MLELHHVPMSQWRFGNTPSPIKAPHLVSCMYFIADQEHCGYNGNEIYCLSTVNGSSLQIYTHVRWNLLLREGS